MLKGTEWQHRELHSLGNFFANSVRVLLCPIEYIERVEGLWDRAYGISSLSKKTRKFNHLQMPALSTQLFKETECWSGWSLEADLLHSSLVEQWLQ